MNVGTGDLSRFRGAVLDRLGLVFAEDRWEFLRDVLRRRAAALGRSEDGYLDWLQAVEGRGGRSETAALAVELTVPETSFFRNIDQFRALAEVVLPPLRQRDAGRPPRLLSAGCATGEEPYSLAITLVEVGLDPEPGWVTAFDASPAALALARAARYSAWSLRETPAELRAAWFDTEGAEHRLHPRIRDVVRFVPGNLVQDDPVLLPPGGYDVIFCRNVVMYFDPAALQAAVTRLTRALTPGGYLFLGHAETLRGLSTDLEVCRSHGTFYYRRPLTGGRRAARTAAPASTVPDREPPGPGPVIELPLGGWAHQIRHSSRRIEQLATQPPGPLDRTDEGPDGTAEVLDLIRRERFAEALALVEAMPGDGDPDRLLLHAALLVQLGELDPARRLCRRLLELDEANAGAHYLLGLAHSGASGWDEADREVRIAIRLDPAFAMPHVHRGLLARRARDAGTAQREFSAAADLLPAEDPNRILLFGGGFTRQALIGFCRAELARGAAR